MDVVWFVVLELSDYIRHDDTAYNTNNRQNRHSPTNQHTQAHMAHKTMTIDGTEYTLVPVEEVTPKSEKKRKSYEIEHAPKKVSPYNMYVKEQRADVTKNLTELAHVQAVERTGDAGAIAALEQPEGWC